ncbi:MAG TPA: disulfide isomerase DsbC N-terminal domain-containing protein [Geomonas sp.]|nr:disulfide isomerase DsbC N-terminal domain-containing protein [Geomonas sp.]
MYKKLLAVAALSLSLMACSHPPTKEQVSDAIKKLVPVNFQVLQVSEIKDVPSLYEVVIRVNGQPVVLYMDKNAKYVFSGSLMSLDKKVNLTVETQKKYMQKQ